MPILKSDASVAPYTKQGAADTKTLPVYLDKELSRIQATLNQLTLLANQVYTVEPKTKLNGMVVNNKAPWNPLGTGDGLVRWNGAAWVAIGGGSTVVTVQSPYTISSAPSVVHSVSSITLANHYLECITTDLSYAVGDKIAFGTLADGATASLKPTGFWNATNVGSVNPSGLPLVMNKTTFAQTAITAANWKIMARVFN